MSAPAQSRTTTTAVATRREPLLLVTNPNASAVSSELRQGVLAALEDRRRIDTVETSARGHAIEIARAAARDGYPAVVALGGDGTMSEVANGLEGSRTALAPLPGGVTNVFCRALGLPADPLEASASILRAAENGRPPRRVDLGVMNDRRFLCSSGIGLGAAANARFHRNPARKARFGEYYFAWAGLLTIGREYLGRRPYLRVRAGGRVHEGLTVVVQNVSPLTYFGAHTVEVCERAGLDTGSLSLATLTKASPLDLFSVTRRALGGPAVVGHAHVEGTPHVSTARVEALGERPLRVEVDGDYVGDTEVVDYGVVPSGLIVLA